MLKFHNTNANRLAVSCACSTVSCGGCTFYYTSLKIASVFLKLFLAVVANICSTVFLERSRSVTRLFASSSGWRLSAWRNEVTTLQGCVFLLVKTALLEPFLSDVKVLHILISNRIYVERAQLERLLSDPDREIFPLDLWSVMTANINIYPKCKRCMDQCHTTLNLLLWGIL